MAVIDPYELSHRYRSDEGRVFLSGSQALARLPYEQLRADRRDGLHTAAYVTGYPGSPLANFDRDARTAAAMAVADGLHMEFQPGMNEELAATAVMGSQLAVTLPTCRYDGIVGVWYGKAPGLDRASDALRHATFAGTSAKGGAIALVGDDPNAKSSTLPSSSGATLVDLHMPIVYPGDVQEAIDLGRHAIAMSRASGLWVSIKVVEAVADGTGSVEVHPDRIDPVVPTTTIDGVVWTPMPSGRTLTPHTLDMEREFHEIRLPLAARYATENALNAVAVRGPSDWVGVVATGQTYHETREALRLLGFGDDQALRDAGIRVLRLAVPVPLERQSGSRVRRRPGRGDRRRGEDPEPRVVGEGRALRPARPSARGGQTQPRRDHAVPVHRHARGRHDRGAVAHPPRVPPRGPHGTATSCSPPTHPVCRWRARPTSAPVAHTTRPPRCPTVRSSAAASAATAWC